MRPSHSLTLLAAACLLSACAWKRGTPDNEPTLKTLAGRQVTVEFQSTHHGEHFCCSITGHRFHFCEIALAVGDSFLVAFAP